MEVLGHYLELSVYFVERFGKFSVSQCEICIPHCEIHIPHCGFCIPQCETENLLESFSLYKGVLKNYCSCAVFIRHCGIAFVNKVKITGGTTVCMMDDKIILKHIKKI